MDYKRTVINGQSIYYYVNDNGAIIEIVEVKTNTFEEGLYSCCTVDIDINVYNDDFSVKVPFTLKNVDSGITCFDWYGDYFEDMYESVVGFNEDKDGNYIGDEEDRAFYEAAKECDKDLDEFSYVLKQYRSEEDYVDWCWDTVTTCVYDDEDLLTGLFKDITKIEKAEDIYEAVDVTGNFEIYEAAAYVGDDFLYGATLFEGEFHIKGIRKSTKEKMCRRVVDCLCRWAHDNAEEYDFEMHNFVNVNEEDLEFGKEYPCGLQKPIVEVE